METKLSIQEFADQMQILACAYLNEKMLGENVLKTWFKFFAEYDADIFKACVNKWIRENKAQPSISELLEKCNSARNRKINEEKRHKMEKERENAWEKDIVERTDIPYDPDDDEFRATHTFDDGWRIDDDSKWVRVRVSRE